MTPTATAPAANGGSLPYSVLASSRKAFLDLINDASLPIPEEARRLAPSVQFTNCRTLPPFVDGVSGGGELLPVLPVPFRETEAISALKGVEAAVAGAIASLRYGESVGKRATIDTEHATLFLLMSYVSSVDGLGKFDEEGKKRLRDTDYFQGQSNMYRRLSANVYETRDKRYFHLHGSLEATPSLNMVGLPGHDATMTEYHAIINRIESAVRKFDADDLDRMANDERKQAGAVCLTEEEFLKTEHGRIISQEPFWDVKRVANTSSWSEPVPFPAPSPTSTTPHGLPQVLAGVRVLELCRIVAGPTISRVLAEYGADVLRVLGPQTPDVPWFQVDGNLGKRVCELDLKSPGDRKTFEDLLQTADVLVDGYRPGAIERLGYGPKGLAEKLAGRKKGFVYVAEDCYGFTGPWKDRAGWQQIADVATGLAWAQGKAMGKDEPIVPPFPMSDYGAGCMGAIAAMTGLLKRAKEGGSYVATCSLVQYDLYLLSLGQYPAEVWSHLRKVHDSSFMNDLIHSDVVDRVSGRALTSVQRVAPHLFGEEADKRGYVWKAHSDGFGGLVRACAPVVKLDGTANAFNETSRPNGWDRPLWREDARAAPDQGVKGKTW